MEIKLNGKPIEIESDVNYRHVIDAYGRDDKSVLGIAVGGKAVFLGTHPREGDTAHTIEYLEPEGRRIYERTLRFVFLLAVRNLYPTARVRMENSAGRGVYARIYGISMSHATIQKIKQEMRILIERDLPFEKKTVSIQEAEAFFRQENQIDKVKLLKYRPNEVFQLYSCGGMMEYFYGEMAPSTGYVPVFNLKLHLPGVMLILPVRDDPATPAAFYDQPQLSATFAESAKWAEILGCSNISDLNEMTENRKLREFIRVNEALHEKSISEIADKFQRSGARLILIAGPSSSGKTTFTHRLSIALRVLGLHPVKLSLDDYYIDRDKIPVDENGERDLERLDTLDVELFNEHLVKILQGETVETPIFDFRSGQRTQKGHTVQIKPGQPILVEGIHGLNEELTSGVPRDMKYMIYISALTTLNLDDHNRIRTTDARLVRRIVRDHLFRGTHPEKTLGMWASVRRGEEKYIFPYQEHADVMFNSTLLYEMAVLKPYVYPMLNDMREDSPHYTLARRLLKFLNYICVAEIEDEVPINSILREFIGGCCFYREED